MSVWWNENNNKNNDVSVNGFKVGIKQSESLYESSIDNGYVALDDNTEYKLLLTNNKSGRCDAHVFIDGESVGIFRVNGYQTITIERPVSVNRKFVFMREKTQNIAKKGKDENGLVRVIFRPEEISYDLENYELSDSYNSKGLMARGRGIKSSNGIIKKSFNLSMGSDAIPQSTEYESGLTVLGDTSRQNFSSVSKLTNIDTKNITTINLRLVVNKNIDKKYISLNEANAHVIHSNSVPPRVDKHNTLWF